jgi:hypothetical protein
MRKAKTTTAVPEKAVISKPFLPPTVERIAAAVANMLTYGGEPDDLERVILATISMETRTRSYSYADHRLAQAVADSQRRQLPMMLKALADFRTELPEVGGGSAAEATHVAELVRQNSRHQCAREFEDFLQDADPEEIRFLSNVLNCQSGNGSHGHELAIATAFFDEIDRDIEIFRVPAKHSAAVDAYIAALLNKPAKESEA